MSAIARSAAVAVFALMTLGIALMARGEFALGAAQPTVQVVPATANVSAGGSVTVHLRALNISTPTLGAATIDIQYDGAVIDATACTPDPDHRFDVPICTRHFPTADTVRVSDTEIFSLVGASGNIVLADITFKAVGQPGDCSPLHVQIETFADPINGQPISATAQDGQVCIPAAPTPSPTTSPEPTASPTPAATDTPTPSSTPGAVETPTPDESLPVSAAMAAGWNFDCQVGSSRPTEEALTAALDNLSAAYRLGPGGVFDRWFPNRPDASTLTEVNAFDALFLLTSDSFVWTQAATDLQSTVGLAEGWNGVCYLGSGGPVETATQGIDVPYTVIYSLAADQTWLRFLPDEPEASNLSQLTEFTPVLVLVTGQNGHWAFNP